jgi:prophage regulatory protein
MERMIGWQELRAAGISWTKVYVRRLEKRGLFPKRIRMGPQTTRWLASEVEAWQAANIAQRKGKVWSAADIAYDDDDVAAE